MKIQIFLSLLSFSILNIQCQESVSSENKGEARALETFQCQEIVSPEKKVEVRALETFNSVEVGESIEVCLNHGDKDSARVEAVNVELSDVLTEISNGELQISIRKTPGVVGSQIRENVQVNVYLTYVKLKKIYATSSSKVVSSEAIKASTLNLTSTSSAALALSLDVDTTVLEVSSSAYVTLTGKTKYFSGEVTSAGELNAYQLESQDAKIKAISSSLAKVSAVRELNLEATSGATIYYQGEPEKLIMNSHSGGSIIKK